MITTTSAQRDDACDECGYPFDEFDQCLLDTNTGLVYCGKGCVKDMNLREAGK